MRDLSEGRATLALETGHCFSGRLIGGRLGHPAVSGSAPVAPVSIPSPPPRGGEVVFHTGMTGYQEILTDPSYRGQVVVFTAPHIGNYGIHEHEDESTRVHPSAIVVRDFCRRSFHQRAERSLEDTLRRAGIPGLTDVDTRALTNVLRQHGSCRGILGIGAHEGLVEQARALPRLEDQDPVGEVTSSAAWTMEAESAIPRDADAFRVAVLDYGAKRSILSQLTRRGCRLRILPAHTRFEEIQTCFDGQPPEGVFLSNGPGDPSRLSQPAQVIRSILQTRWPVFGICLGHQLLARALGARTYKLRFGHHGANHPVQALADGRVAITSHNHNYAVDESSLDPERVRITHRSLNDECIEGIEVRRRPVYSVQFHPEAAPGPRDGEALFDRFREDLAGVRRNPGLHVQQAEGA